jgi:hypothetical protein
MNKKYVLVLSSALLVVIAAHSRPSQPDLSKVDFLSECTTSSDPSNRLLFEHEQVVNSFLDVPRKFGRERMMVMHLGNEHLATHGGTTQKPGEWQENGQLYKLQNNWGMIGDIVEDTPKVYFLNVTSLLRRPTDPAGPAKPNKAKETGEQTLKERSTDPFEAYAISLLKKGEPVVRWERDGFMRAVGAIRSTGACQRCHESKDGDLLGAFTYEFGKTKFAPTDVQKLELKYAEKGKDVEEIAQILKSNKKLGLGNDNRFGAWTVQMDLLQCGYVTPAMVSRQTESRAYLLNWIQSSFNRPNKATAKN